MNSPGIGAANTAVPVLPRGFSNPQLHERNYTISGVTEDVNGAILGSCIVRLYNTATNLVEQTITSSTLGVYSFTVDKTQAYYSVSYKAGASDVYGTTVNTLAGT